MVLLAVAVSGAISALAFHILRGQIPRAAEVMAARGIVGVDLGKLTQSQIKEWREIRARGGKPDPKIYPGVPESLGLITGGMYLCAVAATIAAVRILPLSMQLDMAEFHAALSTVAFALLLGFVDDVLDVRWRYKIVLSALSTLPLLAAYSGATTVLLPIPMRAWLGATVDLGWMYVVAMGLVCIFCSNAVNILAGINGLEVGQTLVIACAITAHTAIEIATATTAAVRGPYLLALLLTLPFVGCAAALFAHNRYPSRVFVGDSFTYFSGMTLAVVGVTGHFSKTLMLFFLPQLVNFAISLPQLVGILPCPRHRVPIYEARPGGGVLVPSMCGKGGWVNLTLLNVALVVMGPMPEARLTRVLLGVQAACCAAALAFRYSMAAWVY